MKFLSLISLLFASQVVLAETIENVMIIEKPKTAIYQDSSAYHRMNKNYQVAWQPLGVNPAGTPGSALSAGFFIDRQSMILAEVSQSSITYSFLGTREIESTTAGIHYKRFLGNSFYVRGGVDYRKVDFKDVSDYSIWTSSTNSTMSFTGESLAASLVIGNQWQWDTFTLGCDWIGVTAPFTSQVRNEKYEGNPDLDGHKSRYVKSTVAQGLRLYLGASF